MTEEQEKLLDSSVELGKLANQADLYADLLDDTQRGGRRRSATII